MTLNAYHTLILAIFVLFLGRWVNRKVGWLREYSIPEPVTGGLLCSVALTLLVLSTGADIRFDLAARDVLLVVFFTTVGLSANLRLLALGVSFQDVAPSIQLEEADGSYAVRSTRRTEWTPIRMPQ